MNAVMHKGVRSAALLLAMSTIGIVFLAPLLFMFISSFKDDNAIFANLNTWAAYLPSPGWSMKNYTAVFDKSDLPSFLLNSTLIAALTVGGGIVVNSMLAYAIARMRWRGRQVVLALVVAMVIVPFEVIAIPLLSLVARLPWPGFEHGQLVLHSGWFNSLHVQVIPFWPTPSACSCSTSSSAISRRNWTRRPRWTVPDHGRCTPASSCPTAAR